VLQVRRPSQRNSILDLWVWHCDVMALLFAALMI